MTFSRRLLATAVAAAAVAASVAGFAGAHADSAFSPSGAPAALSVRGATAGATTNTVQASASNDTTVSVTTLSQAQFTGSLVGVHTCDTLDTLRFCQVVQSSGAHLPTWDVYADLGQSTDLGGGWMIVDTSDQLGNTGIPATAGVGPFVKLHWSSSSIDFTTGSATYVQVTLGGTAYNFNCSNSELPDHSWTGVCDLQPAP